MEKDKSKYIVPGVFFGVLLLAAWYIAYCIGTLGGQQVTLYNVSDLILTALLSPLPIRITKLTTICWGIATVAVLIAFAFYLQTVRNYRFGEEAGSAKIIAPEVANMKLMDADPKNNKIISEKLRISYNTRQTHLNNNMLVLGVSGTGKSLNVVRPNAFALQTSMIFCDPKGELLRDLGNYLSNHGYRVVAINLASMAESDHYNPFAYIKSTEDIEKLVNALIKSNTPKNSSSSDPFWPKAGGMLINSCMRYVYYENPKKGRPTNFREVMKLLDMATVVPNEKSELDLLMEALPKNHPARVMYNKVMVGADDTKRSIIVTAQSYVAAMETEGLLRILDSDDMDIPSIGEGVYGNPKRKTAVFCVVPDSDTTYNFVVSMFYIQLFQQLFYIADHKYQDRDGMLPIHVALWMDEFANVALPDNFTNIITTVRSRNISCNIFIQNLAQLKEEFNASWETVYANCDTRLILGVNDESTIKAVSEEIGKGTYDKRSTSESMGKNGSSSHSYDFYGRELLTPDELRKLNHDKCIVIIRGFDAIEDDKCRAYLTPEFKEAKRMGHYVSKTVMGALQDEGRLHFYIEDTRPGSDESSWLYQIDSYQGIFEEAHNYKCLKKSEDERYLLLPNDRLCLYKISSTAEIVQPVFSAKTKWVEFPTSKLAKHEIVAYKSGDEIRRLTREEAEQIFTKENRQKKGESA